MTCDDGRPCQRWCVFCSLCLSAMQWRGFHRFRSIKREIGDLCRDEIKPTPSSKTSDKSTISPTAGSGPGSEQPAIRTAAPGDSGLPHSTPSTEPVQTGPFTPHRLFCQVLIIPPCPPLINLCNFQPCHRPNLGRPSSSLPESIPVPTASGMNSPSSRKSQPVLLPVDDHATRNILVRPMILTCFPSVNSWNRSTTVASLVRRKRGPCGLVLPFHSLGTRVTPMPSATAQTCCRPRKPDPLHSSQVTNHTTNPHSGWTHTPLGRTKLRPLGHQCLILSSRRNHTHLDHSTFSLRISSPKGIPPSTQPSTRVRSSLRFRYPTSMPILNNIRQNIIPYRCLCPRQPRLSGFSSLLPTNRTEPGMNDLRKSSIASTRQAS